MFGWFPSSFMGKSGDDKSKESLRKSVKVVIVHSHTGGKKMWDFLEKNWEEFGPIKLVFFHQKFVTNQFMTLVKTMCINTLRIIENLL